MTQGARLFGVVSKQPHSLDAKFMQDRSRQAKISAILRELQCMIGLDGIESTILQCVSLQRRHEADAASLLRFVDHQAASFLSNGAHGYVKLLFAVAPKRTQDLTGKALRMNPHQRRGVRQIPEDQRERRFDSLFAARNVPLKGERLKQAQRGRYLSGDNSSEFSGLCDWYHGAPPDLAKSYTRLRRRLWFRNHAAGAKIIFLRCLRCRRHIARQPQRIEQTMEG